MEVVVANSTVKGYHHFKITPHEEVPMLVIPDEGNEFDACAMKVVVPRLSEIRPSLHNVVTRKGTAGRPTTTVKDTAGKCVGRVPANLCKVFRRLLEQGHVADISCLATGKAFQSRKPMRLKLGPSWTDAVVELSFHVDTTLPNTYSITM